MKTLLALILVLVFAGTAVADHWGGHQTRCITRCTRNFHHDMHLREVKTP